MKDTGNDVSSVKESAIFRTPAATKRQTGRTLRQHQAAERERKSAALRRGKRFVREQANMTTSRGR